jgi:hypothetical protein
MKHTLALVALASCVTAPAGTASPPPVPENLQACSKLPDASERVRCYDAQIAAMNAASTATPATPGAAPGAAQANSAPHPPASNKSGATSFSAAASAARAPASAPTSTTTAAPPAAQQQAAAAKFGEEFLPAPARPAKSADELALSSNITGLNQVGPNIYNISLANGQVWRQEGAQITIFFRVGDDVHIKKGLLGSYQMSTAATGPKNWVRVSRLQ